LVNNKIKHNSESEDKTMKNVDRMGVLVLMAHLIITIAVLGLYAYFVHMGKDTAQIETMLLVILGYWFGAMGTSAIRPNAGTQINQANEVKVNQPSETSPVVTNVKEEKANENL
jgi:flagellar basal body-associated protein FliL